MSPFIPNFCILVPSFKSGSFREAAALSHLWFPTHLMPLSPAGMSNPREEQSTNIQTFTSLFEDSVQTRQLQSIPDVQSQASADS